MSKYCKHCGRQVVTTIHNCEKKGLLNVHDDDSFLVSTLIGVATDSALLGGLLGGDIVGGVVGDVHNFFVSIGFDQVLHYIQLFTTYYYLKNGI